MSVLSVIIAIIILGIIIIAHEFGHFLAARKNGVLVEEFAIGMGPKLLSKKRGDTVWSIRAFPIGGFCKMRGEDEDDRSEVAFNSKKINQRFVILIAGVVMNVILALVITSASSLANGFGVPEISRILPDSAAEAAGLKTGDRIIRINKENVNIYQDVTFIMSEANGLPMDITVKRGGEKITFTITPKLVDNGSYQVYQIGFERGWRSAFFGKAIEGYSRAGFFESLKTGAYTSAFYVKSTFIGFLRLFTMKIKASELAGPIGIVSIIGENYTAAASVGAGAVIWTMLEFMALISANLAVANILPLPTLDGGRIVFLLIEGIRKKPIDPQKEGMVHFAGFVLLMIFAVFIAYNDIMKLM
ncbi:zinc metalloprotease [Clostridia bacterium]|nr:zinc metalloprotease [Clostridia bacterium]